MLHDSSDRYEEFDVYSSGEIVASATSATYDAAIAVNASALPLRQLLRSRPRALDLPSSPAISASSKAQCRQVFVTLGQRDAFSSSALQASTAKHAETRTLEPEVLAPKRLIPKPERPV